MTYLPKYLMIIYTPYLDHLILLHKFISFFAGLLMQILTILEKVCGVGQGKLIIHNWTDRSSQTKPNTILLLCIQWL